MAVGLRFKASAHRGDEQRSDTRASAASAMTLADRWAAEGWGDILVASPKGVQRGREAFRATLPLARWFGVRPAF